jgi:hypothetical protein
MKKTVVEVGEDRGQITGTIQSGPRGDPYLDIELVGDDTGQRGLAQARWPGEQDMVQGPLLLESRLQ